MLLLPMGYAQREVSGSPCQHPRSGYPFSQRCPRTRENHLPRSRVIVEEKKSKYVWATILLALSLSATILVIINGTNLVAIGGDRSQVATAGANSFAYSGQWGSYGGPVTPNGVAADSSGNVFIADAKNYAVYELAKDGSLLASWGSQGIGPGHFSDPQGIARDPQGNVYI